MTCPSPIASAPPVRRLRLSAVAAALLIIGAPVALAQQPAPKPAAKPAQKAAQKPAQQPAQATPAQPAQGQAQQQAPQLIYSPWTKFCGKGKEANAKEVCFTGKDARTEAGAPVIAAALIEPEGAPKKLFRITLPAPLQLQYGTRVIIDQEQPMTGPFFTCFSNGCMADYEATDEMVQKLKKGQTLTIQAINLAGSAISFPLPLTDFAKAHEGPPTDPKVFAEQQKKLQEELQKRAEEARKKLEAQGGQKSTPATR